MDEMLELAQHGKITTSCEWYLTPKPKDLIAELETGDRCLEHFVMPTPHEVAASGLSVSQWFDRWPALNMLPDPSAFDAFMDDVSQAVKAQKNIDVSNVNNTGTEIKPRRGLQFWRRP